MGNDYGRLKPELKKKLLKALTSGEYVKGTSRLVTFGTKLPDKFCCLGVLANIQRGVSFDERGQPCYKDDVHPSATYLPATLAGGITDDGQLKLARLNDQNRTWMKVILFIKNYL